MKYTSQIIAAGSGSVGGCVYSRNRYGPYIRNRSIPVNPASVQQAAVRSILAALAVAWQADLTDAQRAAWDTYAANVSKIDKLGRTINVLGINWYTGVNVLRLQSAFPRLDNAPTQFTGTSLSPVILVSTAADDVEIQYTNTDEWAGAVGGHLYVFIGGPTSPTINFFGGPFRLLGAVNGAVVPPTSPAAFTSPIPFVAGQKSWARVVAQAADGRMSTPQIVSAIVQ